MNDLINGRTPEEIVEANRHCSRCFCDECAYFSAIECQTDLKRDCADLIKRLEAQQPKWISVEERLPERYTPVLGYIKKEDTEAYIAHVVVLDGGYWAKDTGVYYDDVGGFITHWMPLPEPPEEEE